MDQLKKLRVTGCGFKKGLAPDWGLMIGDSQHLIIMQSGSPVLL